VKKEISSVHFFASPKKRTKKRRLFPNEFFSSSANTFPNLRRPYSKTGVPLRYTDFPVFAYYSWGKEFQCDALKGHSFS